MMDNIMYINLYTLIYIRFNSDLKKTSRSRLIRKDNRRKLSIGTYIWACYITSIINRFIRLLFHKYSSPINRILISIYLCIELYIYIL